MKKKDVNQIKKPRKCKCNFRPPHPLRVEPEYRAVFNGNEYPEEFFCSFCKGLIVNDMDYIKEVVKYHAYVSASYSTDRNKERARERSIEWFYNKYKELV